MPNSRQLVLDAESCYIGRKSTASRSRSGWVKTTRVVISMELGLNLLWLALAVFSFALIRLGGDKGRQSRRHSLRRALSLTCALVIFFPIISVTDDLHAAQVVMEDSNPSKRPGRSASPLGSSPHFNPASFPFIVGINAESLIVLLQSAILALRPQAGLLLPAATGRINSRGPPVSLSLA